MKLKFTPVARDDLEQIRLVTKFNLVMPAREALLRDVKSVKQSLRNTHYQVELGNELNPENHGSDCLPLLMPAIFEFQRRSSNADITFTGWFQVFLLCQ